jgi:YD repeat-containing protein
MAENETYYSYDKNGWLSSVSRSVPGGKQPLLRINYDGKGNPAEYQRLDAEGKPVASTKLSYNGDRDLTSVSNGEQSMNFSYNSFGKPTQVSDVFNRAAKFEYDKFNRLKAAAAPTGVRTVYSYTPEGMISEVKRFAGMNEKELLSSIKISYDADGRAVAYADNQGREKKLEHDDMGRVIAEYFPDNTAVKYSYTVTGQLQKVIDQNKNPIAFEWNKFGRIAEKTTAANQETDYNYDKYGMLHSVVSKLKNSKSADREIQYSYDAFDRVTGIDYGNKQVKTFKYDSWGKVLQTTQTEDKKVSTADFQYDVFDRLVKKTVSNTGEAGNTALRRTEYEYAYDRYGKRTERVITFNGGEKRKSGWVYDKYGRLVAMNDEGKTVTYNYDNQSRISVRKADNIPVYYTYTRFGQLESKSLGSPFPLSDSKAAPMAYVKYFYSPDGQITARDVSGSKQAYQYDLKGQLLAVVDSTGKAVEQYAYDPAGNILKKTIDGKTTTFKYDRANQLVSSTDASGKVTKYDYDAAGRLTQEGDKSYSYGWLDKVMSVSDNGKLTSTYDYGIDGQLASRTDATGKSENFTWDGLALVKRDSTNFVNESAITGGNPILAFGKDSSKVLFEDMLGSTVGSVEDGKFNAINRTAFGASNSDSELNFFTGKPQVEGLGYAFLFRNYRADQGKWQTQDPIALASMSLEFSDQEIPLAYSLGYPDGWNNLAYCNNSVNRCVDPSGASVKIFDAFYDSYAYGQTWGTEAAANAAGQTGENAMYYAQLALANDFIKTVRESGGTAYISYSVSSHAVASHWSFPWTWTYSYTVGIGITVTYYAE